MKRLKGALDENIFNRLKQTIFGRFIEFYEQDWQFKGRIIAYLYFHMVYPDRDDELHFKFGEGENEKRLKFGKREFGMIMGYRYGSVDWQSGRNPLPLSRCFNESCELRDFEATVTLKKLESVMKNERDVETRYRMGLVYLIYGILLGFDPGTIIPSEIFHIVEDEDFMRDFAWGEYFFNNLMWSWRKIVQDCKKRGPKEGSKAVKPPVYGCIYALQLWSYHALPKLVEEGGHAVIKDGQDNALPSFQRWNCKMVGCYSGALNKMKTWVCIVLLLYVSSNFSYYNAS